MAGVAAQYLGVNPTHNPTTVMTELESLSTPMSSTFGVGGSPRSLLYSYAPSFLPPLPESATSWYGLTLTPPPDLEGYTAVPAAATLLDARMCAGYSAYAGSPGTLAQCRASCDASSGCAGISWGLPSAPVFAPPPTATPSPPPPSPPPQPVLDRRRTLLGYEDSSMDGETGMCYLMPSTPSSSIASGAFTHAGCYANGARPAPVVSCVWSRESVVHWRDGEALWPCGTPMQRKRVEWSLAFHCCVQS